MVIKIGDPEVTLASDCVQGNQSGMHWGSGGLPPAAGGKLFENLRSQNVLEWYLIEDRNTIFFEN